MRGINMDKLCNLCKSELSRADIYIAKDELCTKCRKAGKVKSKITSRTKEIELEGYKVLSLEVGNTNNSYPCVVKCLSCNKVRTSSYRNIVKDKRMCSCKHTEGRRSFIDGLQTKQVLVKIPSEFKVTGIYRINIDDKFYVGSSVNIQTRLRSHFRKLRDKSHSNTKMLSAFNENSVYSFCVLEECLFDDLADREQHYIDTLNPTLNILTSAINPMQDIKLKYSRLCGENNSSCKYTNAEIVSVLFALQDSKDLKRISEETGVGFSTVADMSSGKSFTWLKDEYPEEYAKMLVTKGSMYCYKKIHDILLDLAEGELSQVEMAEKYDMDTSNIQHIKYGKRIYMKRMREEFKEIDCLYNRIGELS